MMQVNWRSLTAQGRIDCIRSVWFPGCSTAQIAANFMDVTRNAIIGMYHRFPNSLTDKPLMKRGIVDDVAAESRRKRRAPVTLLFAGKRASKPLPEAADEPTEARLCGKPLVMLQAKECRWVVNEAVGDALHLFCARPTERTYCSHHKVRAHRGASE